MQKLLCIFEKRIPLSYILLLTIPIALSAFTHLWNPIGFPSVFVDEVTYIKRAMLVLDGLGPQDSKYDHPYFGQLFLAAVFKLIDYPSIVNASPPSTGNNVQHSIEMLYLVPRALMGILAVIDTFLVYKISERRYNRDIAFIASILFAVMPITWYARRILLDSIQLPFLLSSILFAVYYNNNHNNTNGSSETINNNNKEILTILLSGIFLGLAIFTKIPAITMIPLVAFLLVYRSGSRKKNDDDNNHDRALLRRITVFHFNRKNMKMLGLWLIPVILIPLIWPAYAMSTGQFSKWMLGLYYQTHRVSFRLKAHVPNHQLLDSLNAFFKIDPVLLVLGTVGLVFSVVIKRDFLILLWSIPFLILLYFVGFVQDFYLIPVLPSFCLATAIMINHLSNKAGKKNVQQKITKYFSSSYPSPRNFPFVSIIHNNKYPKNIFLSFIIVLTIGILGLISTAILITTNFNSSYFKAHAFVDNYISQTGSSTYNYTGKFTIIGDSLILTPQRLMHKDHYYYKDYSSKEPVKTQNLLLVLNIDNYKRWASSNAFGLGKERVAQAQGIYESAFPKVIFKRHIADTNNVDKYPLTSTSGNWIQSQIEIRTNVLGLNSSAHVIRTSNGTVAKANDSLYNVVLANYSGSLTSYWKNSFWKNSIRNCGHLFRCMINSTTGWKDNNYNNNNNSSLQISTNTTTKHALSSIEGNGIAVIPGQSYQLITHMKLNQYATQSHVTIEAYNQTSNKWYQIMQCPKGTNGPLEWHEYSCGITTPRGIGKVRPVLHAGWSSQPGKQAVTLFDAIDLNILSVENQFKNLISGNESNLVSNSNFAYLDDQSKLPTNWIDTSESCGSNFKCIINATTGWQNVKTSFQISTNVTNKHALASVRGKEVSVTPDQTYRLITHMKRNQYAIDSHVALKAYNQTSNGWYEIMQCPSGTNENFDQGWHEYRCTITIPTNTTKVRPVLYAGWSSQPSKQAITLFDAIYLSKMNMSFTPVLNPTTTSISYNSGRIGDLCKLRGDFDVQVNYKLIEPQVRNGTALNLIAHCSRL